MVRGLLMSWRSRRRRREEEDYWIAKRRRKRRADGVDLVAFVQSGGAVIGSPAFEAAEAAVEAGGSIVAGGLWGIGRAQYKDLAGKLWGIGSSGLSGGLR